MPITFKFLTSLLLYVSTALAAFMIVDYEIANKKMQYLLFVDDKILKASH